MIYLFLRTNKIGTLDEDKKRKKKPEIKFPRKTARTVFEELKKLPKLTEFEKKQLKIYKPSFTKQVLDYSKFDIPPLGRSNMQKGRILYGNETDVNEYPWQVKVMKDLDSTTENFMKMQFRYRCGLIVVISVVGL